MWEIQLMRANLAVCVATFASGWRSNTMLTICDRSLPVHTFAPETPLAVAS